jgi:hypothetical protein
MQQAESHRYGGSGGTKRYRAVKVSLAFQALGVKLRKQPGDLPLASEPDS